MAEFTKQNLKNVQSNTERIIESTKQAAEKIDELVTNVDPLNQNPTKAFSSDGFIVPAGHAADGTGLPFSKVISDRHGQLKRNIITWFVPEFGTVKMYVNPNNIIYTHKKLIDAQKTKGGYSLQYWGEDLSSLNINGTTGSSGIEGMNVLYEIYRAEQYAFDSTALVFAANNDAAQDLATQAAAAISNAGIAAGASVAVGLVGGLFGLNSSGVNNPVSLGKLAFSVEMYYNGWVYRGFFESMTITESADNFLLNYNIIFKVTQKRGYRTNYFPWSRSPKDGPSRDNTPYSYSGQVANSFSNIVRGGR